MRSKENAMDYRYFPEPDLPPLIVTQERIEYVKKLLPELPEERAKRYVDHFGLPEYDAAVISALKLSSDYYENLVKSLENIVSPKIISNFFMTDILRVIKLEAEKNGTSIDEITAVPIILEHSTSLLKLQANGTISGRIAKEIFELVYSEKKSPEDLVREKGLIQISDETSIAKICEQVITENKEQFTEYLSGKEKLFGFFVGQAMKLSGGKLNPSKVNEILKRLIDAKKDHY